MPVCQGWGSWLVVALIVICRYLIPYPFSHIGKLTSSFRGILTNGPEAGGSCPSSNFLSHSPRRHIVVHARNLYHHLAKPIVRRQMKHWIGESCCMCRYPFACRQLVTDTAFAVRLWLPCVFLLCIFAQAGAVNLEQCKANFANETGQSSSPPNITYQQCVDTCGGGPGASNWTMFSQDFSTWLLPWIALIFQLPFGATGV